MVRSKSEVIITNMLVERDIPFRYEVPLYAPDGTFYLPDFTITWQGQEWYWEHVGRLDLEHYRNHWDTKQAWYDKHFPGTTPDHARVEQTEQGRSRDHRRAPVGLGRLLNLNRS